MIQRLAENIQTTVLRSIKTIKPSPENDAIYGKMKRDNDWIDLCNDIAKNGILEALVVTRDHFIISGHRRYAAAKMVKLKTVPVIVLDVFRAEMPTHEYKQLIRRYNHQRHKNAAQRMKEALLDVDPDIAHKQLIEAREERDRNAPVALTITGKKKRSAITYQKMEMLNAIVKIVNDLKAFWPLTVRQVHYQLLNNAPLRNVRRPKSIYGNDQNSYDDLCELVTRARLALDIPFRAIGDETRPVTNTHYQRDAASFVDSSLYHLFRNYRRDLLQSQLDHVELIAEKMTLQNIIQPVADQYCIPTTIGRGYCSLEPRRGIVERFKQSGKDRLILLIMGDHDPDGDEICHSFARSIRDDFGVDVIAHKILLTADQVKEWKLPPNQLEAKKSSSNYKKFIVKFGSDKVYELEAVDPIDMQKAISDAIESVIDIHRFNAELDAEKQDAAILSARKSTIVDEMD